MEENILGVEKNILENLENLDLLLDQYEKIDTKLTEAIDPIFWLRKKSLLKKIGDELDNIEDNLDLLIKMLRGNTLKQLLDVLDQSNDNVLEMAKKMVKIGFKYKKLEQRGNKELRRKWDLMLYKLWSQDELTSMYNKTFVKRNQKYQLNSILEKLKLECKANKIDYEMFMTPQNLVRVRESIENWKIPE